MNIYKQESNKKNRLIIVVSQELGGYYCSGLLSQIQEHVTQ